MPPPAAQSQPRPALVPAKKKKGKDKRAGSPVRSSKSKTSGRKFHTVALSISDDASSAVLNRLPPQGPPEDLEKFDQNRWLEEQLALTQQMACLLYTSPSPRDS